MGRLSGLPIIQAPMAGGPSTPELTAAVSGAGGFGFLAAGYLSARPPADVHRRYPGPQRRRRSGSTSSVRPVPADPAPIRAFAERIRPESERLGVALGDPRWDDDAYGDKLEIVASEQVAMVSFTFGCPDPATVERLHAAGCRVAVTVTSPAEARLRR